MRSARASCSRAGEPRSAAILASLSAAARRGGATSQPRRMPGAEDLARRAGVHHPVRGEALHGADRRAVVAVFGVVVVLDDQRVALAGPRDDRGAFGGGQHGAGRPLVGRGQDHGVGVAGAQRLDADPVVLDRQADEGEAGGPGGGHRVVAGGRVLDRQAGGARGGQHLDHQRDTLGVPGAHHHAVRLGRGAADPVEVVGQGRPERRHAAAGRVAEGVVGGPAEHPAQRAQPGRTREVRDIGTAVAEVHQRTRGRPGGGVAGGHAGRADTVRDRRRAAGPRHQIALGGQLLIGLDDDPAGHAEIDGEHPAGRHRGAGGEPPGADGIPHRRLDLAVQRPGRGPVQLDQQCRIGTRSGHRTGPYSEDRSVSGWASWEN